MDWTIFISMLNTPNVNRHHTVVETLSLLFVHAEHFIRFHPVLCGGLSLRVYLCVWIGIYFYVAYIRTLYHWIPQQVYSTYLFIQVYDYVFRWEICVGSSLAGFVDGFQFAHILPLDIGQGFGNNLQHGSHVTNPKAFWVYISLSVCMCTTLLFYILSSFIVVFSWLRESAGSHWNIVPDSWHEPFKCQSEISSTYHNECATQNLARVANIIHFMVCGK